MHGKALVVDLTTKTTQEQEIPQKYYDQYIGGRGLGGRLLHDLVDPKVDPLGPENVLMFVCRAVECHPGFLLLEIGHRHQVAAVRNLPLHHLQRAVLP